MNGQPIGLVSDRRASKARSGWASPAAVPPSLSTSSPLSRTPFMWGTLATGSGQRNALPGLDNLARVGRRCHPAGCDCGLLARRQPHALPEVGQPSQLEGTRYLRIRRRHAVQPAPAFVRWQTSLTLLRFQVAIASRTVDSVTRKHAQTIVSDPAISPVTGIARAPRQQRLKSAFRNLRG